MHHLRNHEHNPITLRSVALVGSLYIIQRIFECPFTMWFVFQASAAISKFCRLILYVCTIQEISYVMMQSTTCLVDVDIIQVATYFQTDVH